MAKEPQIGTSTASEPATLSQFYRRSDGTAPKLRVGLLLDGPMTSAVVAKIIEDIRGSNFATIELVVFHDRAPAAAEAQSAWKRKAEILLNPEKRRLLLLDRYTRRDRARAPKPAPDAPTDCTELLRGVPQMRVRPIGKKFVHRFPDDALAEIGCYQPDVILRFGFNILRGGILRAARFGVWSYHHGDNDAYRGGPALLWELIEANPESGVILQVLEEALDDGVVLRKSIFQTEPGLSWSHNRFGPYWGSQHFVIETLWRVHNFGWDQVRGQSAKSPAYQGKRALYRHPNNVEMAHWLSPHIVKRVLGQRDPKQGMEDHWKIALRRLPSEQSAITEPLDLAKFQWIESPKGHFWADPFLFEWHGNSYLFIEDLDYSKRRALLSVAMLGKPDELLFQTCLDDPFHLSYPAVFSCGERVYMIPETRRANDVRLYEAVDFPVRWRFVKTLLHLPAVDTTPWFDGERWWLFVTTSEPGGFCPSLLLFSSTTLDGEWHYHPANPLTGDLKFVRNGGAIFQAGGKLYRPSQSGRGGYGSSFSLNEIVRLDAENYEERTVATVEPHGVKDLFATHTYGRGGGWEVVDGCFRLPISQVR